MSRSRTRLCLASPVLLAALTIGALALAAAPAAAAKPTTASAKPRVSFRFRSNRINSKQYPKITYTSANLPSGTKLELQRQFGTARVWKDVMALDGKSGTATAPRVQMGRYRYRIKAYRHGVTVVLSPSELLYSYGRIPLANICNDGNNTSSVSVNGTNSCQTSTVQVSGTVFVYLMQVAPPAPPSYEQDITFGTNTSCRTISFQFAMDNNAGTSDTADLELVQTAADPQKASVGYGQIGSAFFKLDGGPWDLDVSVSGNDYVYLNGYASCWSPGGIS